jgi:hypothetical protein
MASTTLYRLYDRHGALLNIGITENWRARRRSHASTKHRWPEVASMRFEEHPDRDAALLAEARAIHAERPRHNGDPAEPTTPHQHLVQGIDDGGPAYRCRDPSCRRWR